jgi:hypothetical protein
MNPNLTVSRRTFLADAAVAVAAVGTVANLKAQA